MTRYHFCVWIDHREARVFGIGPDDFETGSLTERQPIGHIHRKVDHVGLGAAPVDRGFLGEVASALKPAKAILIAGPGRDRTELAGYLNEEFPALARRIWAIEPMDHPTDAQIAAAARKYFRAADRLHK